MEFLRTGPAACRQAPDHPGSSRARRSSPLPAPSLAGSPTRRRDSRAGRRRRSLPRRVVALRLAGDRPRPTRAAAAPGSRARPDWRRSPSQSRGLSSPGGSPARRGLTPRARVCARTCSATSKCRIPVADRAGRARVLRGRRCTRMIGAGSTARTSRAGPRPVRSPVLVLGRPGPAGAARTWFRYAGGCGRRCEIADCGHLLIGERPDAAPGRSWVYRALICSRLGVCAAW